MAAYQVSWTPEAEDELAVIWQATTDRNAVVRASATADQTLGVDPHQYGDTLAEGLWAITVPPLRVYYQIDDTASSVAVTGVRLLG